MQWFRMYAERLDDPKVQRVPGGLFKAALIEVMPSGTGPFARHVKPGRDRPSGPVWQTIRTRIFGRDDYTCQYCGERAGKLECDHVIPVSRGGPNTDDNLVTACRDCNRSKRDKTPEEWLQ